MPSKLTRQQVNLLDELIKGKRQSEIADETGRGRSAVVMDVLRAAEKLGVKTSWQAVAVWNRHRALLDVAAMIEAANPKTYPNPTLTVLAQDCRALAERLVP